MHHNFLRTHQMFYIKYLEEGHLNFTRNTKIWTIREQRKEIVIKTSYHIKFQFVLHKTTAQKKIVFVAFFSWNILKAIWLFLSVHCTRKGWKWKGKIIIRWIFSSLDEIFLLFFFKFLKHKLLYVAGGLWKVLLAEIDDLCVWKMLV